jgi:protein-disulfide isomerase
MRKPFFVLLLAAVSVFAQTKAAPKAAAPAVAPSAPSFQLPPRALGNPNAPICIEVYSDFECPTCKMLYLSTLKPLMNEYVNTGKVYLIHHDFPLPQHRYSRLAAQWADAAVVTGKYEVVADALFNQQDAWTATGKVQDVISSALSAADFAKAKEMFDAHKGDITAIINADVKAGTDLKLQETPTTRVSKNGQVITDKQAGLISYAVLKKYLDQQLGK